MENKPAAQIVISMDHTLSFKHTYTGHLGLLTPMLGAIKFSEDWVINQIKNLQIIKNQNPLCDKQDVNSVEVEVSRDVAVDMYMKAMEKMRDRVLAIGRSDQNATFHLDPSLLEKI